MPGGSRESYASLGPMLEKHLGQGRRRPVLHLCRSRRRRPFREDGAQRHRVRRHAADRGGVRPDPAGDRQVGRGDRARSSRTWNSGDLESFLIEITADVLRSTSTPRRVGAGRHVLDQAEQKGTGRWTVQNALDLGVPITGIAEATFARALSGSVPQREAAGRCCRRTPRSGRHRPRRLHRGRPAGAVRVQGRRLLPGLRPDRRGQR